MTLLIVIAVTSELIGPLVRRGSVAESSFDLEKRFVEFGAVGSGCGTGVLQRDV